MGWAAVLILCCTHLAVLALGIVIGEQSKRVYKKQLYKRLYGGRAHESQFLNTRRHTR